jgi:hypothetical protein
MSDLKDKIFLKIDDEKPTNAGYFVALDWIRAFAITMVFFLGGILLAFLLWDWILIPQIIDFTADNLSYVFLHLLPLVFILIIISSLLGYMLYRQTDWPLVQKRGLLIVIALSTLLLVTIISLVFIKNNLTFQKSLNDFDDQLQQHYPIIRPPRPRTKTPTTNVNPPVEVVLGKINELETQDSGQVELTVETRLGVLTFDVSPDMTKDLKIDDVVRLDLDPNNLKTVEKITKLDPSNSQDQEPVTFSIDMCNNTKQPVKDPNSCSIINQVDVYELN